MPEWHALSKNQTLKWRWFYLTELYKIDLHHHEVIKTFKRREIVELPVSKTNKLILKDLIERDPQLKFLPDLITLAAKHVIPQKIILFGSRARGDHSPSSDVDIAFNVPDTQMSHWPRFVAEVEESLKTLLKLDLVRID